MRYRLKIAAGMIAGLILVVAAKPPTAASEKPDNTPVSSTWWAFRSPVKSPVPAIPGVNNPIDAFLLAKLRAKALDYAVPADRRTLIRRVTFDLTGLPPTPDEVDAFTSDKSPNNWKKVIDRLLASPRYGERWGRHWLDVVRFGETDGGEHNHERWNSWPYRDYVIQALNQDLPYNQFIREQLAGDILFPSDRSKIAATGFLVAGPWDQVSAELNKDPVMKKTARMDELDDMVTTTCASFLALTVNCARCHNHKFDPIPSRDYYRFTAVFSGAGFGERGVATPEEKAKYDALVKPIRAELGTLNSRIEEIENPVTARILLEKYRAFDESRRAEKSRIPLNPIFNRNEWKSVTARYWRLAILGQYRANPKIERLELRPAGHIVKDWTADREGTPDNPVILTMDLGSAKSVSEVIWWTDQEKGSNEGAIQLYRVENSEDGKTWQQIGSNLDHIGRLEQDLPQATNEEIEAALSPEVRVKRSSLITHRDEQNRKLGAIPSPARIYACNPHDKPEKAFLLDRGSVQKPKEEVTPGALTAVEQLPPLFNLPPEAADAQRRVALADWIANPMNPLAARVIVNRVWYYHFGNGIVNTPSDFGLNGDRPSHQELLDWLAVSFVEHGWSLKWLHKQILTSQAYLQSDAYNAKAHEVDAGNRLVWHMPLRRMDAETLRDTVLSVSGNLDLREGGPSFQLHEKGARGSYIYHTMDNDGPPVWRRAVYRFVVRGGDKTLLDNFDCPDPSVATPVRQVSNTPVQALTLMNNAFVIRQADLLAKRLERESPTPVARVKRAYKLALSRDPSVKELSTTQRFLERNPLYLFCRALLNSNEFVYVP